MSLTPVEHLEVRNWQEAVGMGGPWHGSAYGALLCFDESGAKVTTLTEDIEFHRLLVGADDALRAKLVVPAGKYLLTKSGWPGERGWRA